MESGATHINEPSCAWATLFGACSKAGASGACPACAKGNGTVQVKAIAERVKAACIPSLAAEITV
eukprot:587133-Pleurochrysis_carterae.AAC.1